MKSNQKYTTKLGESDQGNVSVEGLSVSVKIKPLFQLVHADSDTGLLTYACYLYSTVTHNDAFTFFKILMIIIIITHTHAHTQSYFPNQLIRSKSLSQLVLKSKVKEQNRM